MDYKEAVKTVRATTNKENWMVIKYDWNGRIILPYKDGIAFIAALSNAKKIKDINGDRPNICAFDRDELEFTVMSHKEYEQIQIAHLLRLTVGDIKQMEEECSHLQ